MNKLSEFSKNTVILMVGKFSTQFVSFLLIPIYTRFYDTADYGIVDLMQGYISLFVPLLLLRFDSAVFRFLIDERNKDSDIRKKEIITDSLFAILTVLIVFTPSFILLVHFVNIKYSLLIYFNIISIMTSNILLQIARGLGKNTDYSIGCLLCSIAILFTNIILIFLFSVNAGGILIASIVGNSICSVFILIKLKLTKYISRSFYDKTLMKEMLRYSIPMMPNTISWWTVNISDRTLISIVWSTALSGIYSIACKFSNIVNSFYSVFNMSWQENASIHIEDANKEAYFSRMITDLLSFFVYIILGLMSALPIFFPVIVGEQYQYAYKYIPVLLTASIFHILIQLLGGIYIAQKQTKKIMNTTLASAIINLVINILLIRKFALFAASISTLIAYASMAIYRYVDSKKTLQYSINFKKIIPYIILLLFSIIAFYIQNIFLSLAFLAVVLLTGLYKWYYLKKNNQQLF